MFALLPVHMFVLFNHQGCMDQMKRGDSLESGNPAVLPLSQNTPSAFYKYTDFIVLVFRSSSPTVVPYLFFFVCLVLFCKLSPQKRMMHTGALVCNAICLLKEWVQKMYSLSFRLKIYSDCLEKKKLAKSLPFKKYESECRWHIFLFYLWGRGEGGSQNQKFSAGEWWCIKIPWPRFLTTGLADPIFIFYSLGLNRVPLSLVLLINLQNCSFCCMGELQEGIRPSIWNGWLRETLVKREAVGLWPPWIVHTCRSSLEISKFFALVEQLRLRYRELLITVYLLEPMHTVFTPIRPMKYCTIPFLRQRLLESPCSLGL